MLLLRVFESCSLILLAKILGLSLVTVLLPLSVVSAFPQPRFKDKANHAAASKDYEIREEDIISLPVGRFPEPECEYSVLYGGPWGWPIAAANLGDPIYHQWSCSTGSPMPTMYCIEVVNCTVSDVQSRRSVPIIDADGCSLDISGTIPNVEYHGDLEGGIKTTAFSLDIDSGAVKFNCGLKLSIKDSNTNNCVRSICSDSSAGSVSSS